MWLGPPSGKAADLHGWRRPFRQQRAAPNDALLMAPPPPGRDLPPAGDCRGAAVGSASGAMPGSASGEFSLGAGAGPTDRVAAGRLAVTQAGDLPAVQGPVIAASDAFFPFPDGPQILIDAGVTCLIHPGGSKRDDETFALCEEHGITCLLTGIRHFRH